MREEHELWDVTMRSKFDAGAVTSGPSQLASNGAEALSGRARLLPARRQQKGVKTMRRKFTQSLRAMAAAGLLGITLAMVVMLTGNCGTSLVPRAEAATVCSAATVQGNYALYGQGTITGSLPGFPPPPFPTDHVGIVNFDGAGNFSGSETASVNGFGEAATLTFTGTYTVNPDCTATATLANSLGLTVHEAGIISGNGQFQEIHLIVTDAGWVFDETLKKQ